jgi:hypothetical protein
LFGFLAVAVGLFSPFLAEARQLYSDSVTWQLFQRYRTPLPTRLETTAIFWLAISPFAVAAVLMRRVPLWLSLGFATGCVFIFTSSAYPPYFVPVAPYAALLGAPIAARIARLPWTVLAGACLTFVSVWATIVLMPASRQIIPASTFSEIRPIVRLIARTTSPGTPILANRFEYAYLANRPSLAHYFWDHHNVVTARDLEQLLRPGEIVVLYPRGGLSSFPAGLAAYLNRNYSQIQVSGAAIWFGDQVADRLGVRQTAVAGHG